MTTRKTAEQRLADIDSTRKRLRERVAAGKDPQLAKDIRNVRRVQAAVEARLGAYLHEGNGDLVNLCKGTLINLESLVDEWVSEVVPA